MASGVHPELPGHLFNSYRTAYQCINVFIVKPGYAIPEFQCTFMPFMKKILVSISALCYFIVTCGVVINLHYCMDRLASTELYSIESKQCGICGMDIHKSKGCCRDEVRMVKMQDDQNKTLITNYDIPLIEPVVGVPSDFIAAHFYNINEQRHFHNHSPPLLSAQDTYLQNNVFRI